VFSLPPQRLQSVIVHRIVREKVIETDNRRRPVRKVAFSNPRIWKGARHKPTSIAGG
jgi:hypothetical protein